MAAFPGKGSLESPMSRPNKKSINVEPYPLRQTAFPCLENKTKSGDYYVDKTFVFERACRC